MKIMFELVDDKTPFKVTCTGILTGTRSPSFWINSEARFNPKTKKDANGFVFSDPRTATEFACRFMSQVWHAFPEEQAALREYMEMMPKTEFNSIGKLNEK